MKGKLTSWTFKSLSIMGPAHFSSLRPFPLYQCPFPRNLHFLAFPECPTTLSLVHFSLLISPVFGGPSSMSLSSEGFADLPDGTGPLSRSPPMALGVRLFPGFYPALLTGDQLFQCRAPEPQELMNVVMEVPELFLSSRKPERNGHVSKPCTVSNSTIG